VKGRSGKTKTGRNTERKQSGRVEKKVTTAKKVRT
jgi:hypothetical protein